MSFVSNKRIHVLSQPPYSPDMNSRDSLIFSIFKSHLKGYHFGTVNSIQQVVIDQQKVVSVEFQHCFQEWKRCIASQRNHSEMDNIDFSLNDI